MHIHFSVTAEDYQEFRRAYFARLASFWQRHHLLIFVSFGIIVILAALNWIWVLHRDRYYGFVCLACGLSLVWLGLWRRFWSWRRWFTRNAHDYENIEAEPGEEHMITRTKSEETKSTWDRYKGFAETENLILLCISRESYLILPKRAFEPADLGAFRELLQKKFGKIAL